MQPTSESSGQRRQEPGRQPAPLNQAQPEAAAPGAGEFVAVTGAEPSSSAEVLLCTAYVAMWVVLLGFVYLTFRHQRRLQSRIAQLEHLVLRAESRDRKDVE